MLFPRLHCNTDLIPVWKPFSWEKILYAQFRTEWSYCWHYLRKIISHSEQIYSAFSNDINLLGSFKNSAALVSVFDS